jgi:hypothetical protein
MSPQRIQLRRTKGWRMPAGTVKVDRSTKWGNPERALDRSAAERLDAYRWFERHLRERRASGSAAAFIAQHVRYPSDTEIRAELAGRDLACWCRPDQPCHADVLLEIANGGNS